MRKILVTGATGFLGKYLVSQLLDEGCTVLAMGRNEEAGKELEKMGAVFCKCDFTDKNSCSEYFSGLDCVIHAGALSTVWGKWEEFYRINVEGTKNICELCIENNVKRLVYISSPSIYSGKRHRYGIREEEVNEKNELNYYIKSKILAEKIIREFNFRGLYTVVLRPRGLIGIGDTSLIPRVLQANKKSGVPLFNGGENYVDVTCVENVALACVLASKKENINGEVFNITNGEPMRFRIILEKFLSAIDEKPRYLRLPFGLVYRISCSLEKKWRKGSKPGEPPLTRYTVCTLAFSQTLDITRAKEKLGYKPIKTLSEGIVEYGRYWKNSNSKTV